MSAGPVTPLIALPERVRIVLAYLLSGRSLDFRGRLLHMTGEPLRDGGGLRAYRLVQPVEARIIQADGTPGEVKQTVLGYHMDLTNFLLLAQALTPGDLERMQQLIREE